MEEVEIRQNKIAQKNILNRNRSSNTSIFLAKIIEILLQYLVFFDIVICNITNYTRKEQR